MDHADQGAYRQAHDRRAIPVGIKVYGADLKEIEAIGARLEHILRDLPGTRSVFAERVAGGYEESYLANARRGYPPTLARTLDLARDLVSDIQKGTPADVSRCFPDSEWVLDANGAFRYLILRGQTGGIKLQWRESTDEQSRLVVLVRVYGSPSDTPFRIQLRADKEGGFRC